MYCSVYYQKIIHLEKLTAGVKDFTNLLSRIYNLALYLIMWHILWCTLYIHVLLTYFNIRPLENFKCINCQGLRKLCECDAELGAEFFFSWFYIVIAKCYTIYNVHVSILESWLEYWIAFLK